MASLTAHLRQPDEHGRLAFHPQCPHCRTERLAGALPADPIAGRRATALFAAGALALTTATPAAAFAQDPDSEREGVTVPDQVTAGLPPADAGFDPGGQSEVPIDAAPAPQAQAVPGSGDVDNDALEQEPAIDDVAPMQPVAAIDAPAPATDETPAPAPVAPVAPAPPPGDPVVAETPEPPPSAPASEAPVATEQRGAPQSPAQERDRERTRPPRAHAPAPVHSEAPPGPAPTRAPTTVHVAQPQPTASSPNTANRRHAAQRGERFHVVQRDESLWSIARDVLGDDASVARIAREVNRLWELNSARIGTGDRDLLMAGTRLVLR